MKYGKKPNAIVTSINNIRGLGEEDVKPLVGDKVNVLQYFDENGNKIAYCENLSRETKWFGIPVSNLQKIRIKPIYQYEYKKEYTEDIREDFLDKNGAEGWELVSIESDLLYSKTKTLYFKRIISHTEVEDF